MEKKITIKEITSGVCGSLVDFLIWQVALVGASFGKSGSRGVYQAFAEADEILGEVNHHTLAATWHNLTKKRLITYQKRNSKYYPEITKFGKARLDKKIPTYHKNRPWNKRIYLINYDIPEKYRIKRDRLRLFLYKIKATSLQESVFLTPYDPRQLVTEFLKEYNIPGTVIISDIGPDGAVGETDIHDLLIKLYSLDKLNQRYEDFIENVKKNKPPRDLIFEYLSILRDDPQLPFPLLPIGWLGDKAYLLYCELQKIYINSHAAA